MDFRDFDEQMRVFPQHFWDDVHLRPEEINQIATLIAGEIQTIDAGSKCELIVEDPISLANRLTALKAHQLWRAESENVSGPGTPYARVTNENYFCLVYLGDACLKKLKNKCAAKSVTHRVCRYLTDNPVRAFRNAIAHGNWCYADDFQSIVYYARKGDSLDEPLTRFEVPDARLAFWWSLARCTAYTAYLVLANERLSASATE